MDGRLIWDNDQKTILRHIYTGKATREDVLEMASKTHDLLSNVPHTVHLIVELSGSARSIYQSFVQASAELDRNLAPNQGLVVVVEKGFTGELTAKAVKDVAPGATSNIHTARSVDEARAYIARYG